jgi:hypothetical protein
MGHEQHLVAHIADHFMHFADFGPPLRRGRNLRASRNFGQIRELRTFV